MQLTADHERDDQQWVLICVYQTLEAKLEPLPALPDVRLNLNLVFLRIFGGKSIMWYHGAGLGLKVESEGGQKNSVIKSRILIEFGIICFILANTLVLDRTWISRFRKLKRKGFEGSQSDSLVKRCNPIEFGLVCDCRYRRNRSANPRVTVFDTARRAAGAGRDGAARRNEICQELFHGRLPSTEAQFEEN
ncbi:hypothetical protein EVAR_88656_1 [Eumeta japonica]|uniref:Uncharacterized protein n=1 Tax=Eumeta variegata TaxID=151549 RepID=A0A4C1YA86_EUMVA|nr:hypothetical protein EVAR_88656_1 [Eumeta japonica]